MAYKLEFSKRFDKQFSKLDKSTQRYLFNWLIKNVDNVENPRYSGKSLTGNKTGLWRYRIGVRSGHIVYDGPTDKITKEILDEVYNGKAIPTSKDDAQEVAGK